MEVVYHISSSWVQIISFLDCLEQNLGHLYLKKKLRLPSVFKNIEVVFHISSSWIKIRLHTENQLRGLPGGSAVKVSLVVVVGSTSLCGHINFVFGLTLGCDKNVYICLFSPNGACRVPKLQKFTDSSFLDTKTFQIEHMINIYD
jgi:hypothetical protein